MLTFSRDSSNTLPAVFSGRWPKIAMGIFSITISLTIGWINLDQGWFPHDEGQLGQAAERVYHGELPHRDFDDMYTGGLSFLNALSFHLWGINSQSIRMMLFVWFVPFVVSVYWLLTQFTKSWVAGLLTMLASAWSIPMYSAGMPSWYNLFFATWTMCAVMKFISSGAKRYLFFAGLAIGMSIVFKISGLFVMAAVLLFLLYRNQIQTRIDSTRRASLKTVQEGTNVQGHCHQRRTNGEEVLGSAVKQPFSLLVSVALLGASFLSLIFINRHDTLMQVIHFILPFTSLTLFVLHNEWRSTRSGMLTRLREFFGEVLPLVTGVAIPVSALLVYYYRHDAIGDWLHGTFIMPRQRIAFASAPFPALSNLIFTLPLVVLLYPSLLPRVFREKKEKGLLLFSLVAAVALLALRNTNAGFTLSFQSFRNLGPFLILGNLLLIYKLRDQLPGVQRQQLFAATAIAFFTSLVQFPFALPIYFFYVAPLFLVTALMATRVQLWVPQKTLAVVALFFLLLSYSRFHTSLPNNCLQPGYVAYPSASLQTERCHLRIDERMAQVYNRVQTLIGQHSTVGETIFSTPDAPEISYLTNRRAFNGVMYEFFHEKLYDDLSLLKDQLDRERVNLVIVKEIPGFSKPVSDEFRATVLVGFECLETIDLHRDGGRTLPMFTVYKRRSADDGRAEF